MVKQEEWSYVFLAPPFVLGACLAMASKVSVGLLLYGGVGFLQALSVILATLAGALAFGVWTGRAIRPEDSVDGVRRRWLLTLVAFTAAVIFAGAWEYFGAFGVRPWSQAVGLALLAGLPFFFGGSLLGAITRPGSTLQPPAGHSRLSPGVGVILGAGAGFLVSGFFLFPRFSAPHLLLVCVILLSAGALIHGWILDQVVVARTVEERDTPRGVVSVERWVRGRPRKVVRTLLENGRVRGMEGDSGEAELPGEAAARKILEHLAPPRVSVFVGGGALTLPRLLKRTSPGSRVVVLEENPTVTELALAHFAALKTDRLEVHHGPLRRENFKGLPTVDLVVVSGSALGGGRRVPVALLDLLPWIDSLLRPAGVAVLYGVPRVPGDGSPASPPSFEALLDAVALRFPVRHLYRHGDETILVLSLRTLDLPEAVGDFRAWSPEGSPVSREAAKTPSGSV